MKEKKRKSWMNILKDDEPDSAKSEYKIILKVQSQIFQDLFTFAGEHRRDFGINYCRFNYEIILTFTFCNQCFRQDPNNNYNTEYQTSTLNHVHS